MASYSHYPSIYASFNRDDPECIMCSRKYGGEVYTEEVLHKASTKQVDESVKRMAEICKDYKLLARLQTAVDMPAMDAYYHRNCYVNLQNKTRSCEREKHQKIKKMNSMKLL